MSDLIGNQKIDDSVKEQFAALREKGLARTNPTVIQSVIKELETLRWSSSFSKLHPFDRHLPENYQREVESHLRDVLRKHQYKRIAQVEKETGLDDVSQIISDSAWGDPMFWIRSDGTIGHIPLSGHHEDEAYQTFGEGKKRAGNWIRVAQTHGWVRGVLRKNGELNLEYLKGKMAPKAKNSLIKLLMAMKEEISRVVFEWPTGKTSQNQVTNDIRSALVLIRQG